MSSVRHPGVPSGSAPAAGEPPSCRSRRPTPRSKELPGALFILTMLAVLPIVICILCDWSVNGAILWSGYAAGGVLLLYILAVLPCGSEGPTR